MSSAYVVVFWLLYLNFFKTYFLSFIFLCTLSNTASSAAPQNSTVLKDGGIEPWTVAALALRTSRPDLIQIWSFFSKAFPFLRSFGAKSLRASNSKNTFCSYYFYVSQQLTDWWQTGPEDRHRTLNVCSARDWDRIRILEEIPRSGIQMSALT